MLTTQRILDESRIIERPPHLLANITIQPLLIQASHSLGVGAVVAPMQKAVPISTLPSPSRVPRKSSVKVDAGRTTKVIRIPVLPRLLAE